MHIFQGIIVYSYFILAIGNIKNANQNKAQRYGEHKISTEPNYYDVSQPNKCSNKDTGDLENFKHSRLKIEKQTVKDVGTVTRACTSGRLVEGGKSCISQKTCLNEAIRIWNQLPTNVTQCLSFNQVKIQFKLYAKTLPI